VARPRKQSAKAPNGRRREALAPGNGVTEMPAPEALVAIPGTLPGDGSANRDGIPGLEGPTVQTRGRREPSFEKFMTGAESELAAWTSTVLSKEDLACLLEMRAWRNYMTYGDPIPQELEFIDLAGRIGVDGRGRKDAKEVAIAENNLMSRLKGRGISGLFGGDGGMDDVRPGAMRRG